MATENDNNFDAAFAQIMEQEKSGAVIQEAAPAAGATTTQAPASGTETPAADQTVATITVEETPKTPEELEVERVATEKAASEEAIAAKAEENFLNKFASAVRKAVPEPEPDPRQQQVQQTQQEAPLFTADEQAVLSKYMTEFPDIANAEFLRRRGEYGALLTHVFSEVTKTIAPMAQQLAAIADRTHLGDLIQTVPTYASDREKVVEWVKEQPTYLRQAFERVIAQGTVDEVADLIGRYKQSAGVAQTIPAAVPRVEADLPPAAKKAVAALAPVSSKRSVAIAAAPTDFESAFAAYATQP